MEGSISYALWHHVRHFSIQYAPSDTVLFEILRHAQLNSVKHKELWKLNFGYNQGLYPDTQYMINMIMFFDPTNAVGTGIIKEVGYYPILYRHEARKFEATEEPFYNKINQKYFAPGTE